VGYKAACQGTGTDNDNSPPGVLERLVLLDNVSLKIPFAICRVRAVGALVPLDLFWGMGVQMFAEIVGPHKVALAVGADIGAQRWLMNVQMRLEHTLLVCGIGTEVALEGSGWLRVMCLQVSL
jgi:hypothetical protein